MADEEKKGYGKVSLPNNVLKDLWKISGKEQTTRGRQVSIPEVVAHLVQLSKNIDRECPNCPKMKLNNSDKKEVS